MTGAHIHDQDLIYVKQCDDVKSGTIAVILIGNTEVTVKRIIKKEPFLILEAANPTAVSYTHLSRVIKYMARRLMQAGVEVRLNCKVEKAMLQGEFADYEVIASNGAVPSIIKAFTGFKPVSYTHLDVYKRQRLRCTTPLH